MMDSRLYELYKPLRNHLRQVSIENAFYVIWAYINFLQFDCPIPNDIGVHESILKNKKSPTRSIYEWELALLAREIITNGEETPEIATKTFQSWNYLANTLNSLKEFENHAWPIFGSQKNILKEMRRIAHRQFPWQTKVNSSSFLRYFKVYNNPRIRDIIEKAIGLTVRQWYTIGMAFMGATLSHVKCSIDPDILIPTLSKKEFDIFAQFASADLSTLRNIIEKEVSYDDEFVYTLNPLEYYPLVRIGGYYYCPVINFLAWRITSGLFFDLVDVPGFGHPFGLAFQDYLHELSTRILASGSAAVISEQKYTVGKKEKDSVDIILSQNDAAVFVEAKAKRMRARSKSQLISDDAINKDLDILADDVVQVYATIEDYKQNRYPFFPFSSKIRIYPLIVTMEDWFLLGEDCKTLVEKTRAKIEKLGLPAKNLEEMPYTICSASNFEDFLQILNDHSIIQIMEKWFTSDREGHNFGQFLITTYQVAKVLTDFFPGGFNEIYSPASTQ